MLTFSCVTFVSAAEPDAYYPYYDFSINGIQYSSLPGSFMCIPSVYEEYAEYDREFVYDGTDTIELSISTSFTDTYLDFSVINNGVSSQPSGISSLSFYDFYLSPVDDSDSTIIECSFNLGIGTIANDVVADIYYSHLGSAEIIHKTINLITDGVSVLSIDDFPEYLNGVYVHSLTLSTDITLTYELDSINCTVYTGWTDRAADIEYAESIKDGNVLNSLFDVFTSVIYWLSNSLDIVVSLFFVNGKFTVIGILSIIATAISIVLLLISIIVGFVRFRR